MKYNRKFIKNYWSKISLNINSNPTTLPIWNGGITTPPIDRPEEWSKTNLKKILSQLYRYRSDSLHGGIPFPEPMCRPPGIPEICSTALATYTLGGSWKSDDLPININTFNYMVNGILNNWWNSLINAS